VNSDSTDYNVAMFAEWGMWLDTNDDGDNRINRFTGAGRGSVAFPGTVVGLGVEGVSG